MPFFNNPSKLNDQTAVLVNASITHLARDPQVCLSSRKRFSLSTRAAPSPHGEHSPLNSPSHV